MRNRADTMRTEYVMGTAGVQSARNIGVQHKAANLKLSKSYSTSDILALNPKPQTDKKPWVQPFPSFVRRLIWKP